MDPHSTRPTNHRPRSPGDLLVGPLRSVRALILQRLQRQQVAVAVPQHRLRLPPAARPAPRGTARGGHALQQALDGLLQQADRCGDVARLARHQDGVAQVVEGGGVRPGGPAPASPAPSRPRPRRQQRVQVLFHLTRYFLVDRRDLVRRAGVRRLRRARKPRRPVWFTIAFFTECSDAACESIIILPV